MIEFTPDERVDELSNLYMHIGWLKAEVKEQAERAEQATAEAAMLLEALKGADWTIKKLVPLETMAIQIRGHRVSEEDRQIGMAYRVMIDEALASTTLAAAHLAQDAKRDEALSWYADTENWGRTLAGITHFCKAALDAGAIAREALREGE